MKSIEELARELVKEIEVRRLDSRLLETFLMTCPQYAALKSALDKPVEKEPEWPKYYRSKNGNIFKFDDAIRGATMFLVDDDGGGIWGICKNAWSLDEVTGKDYKSIQIPTAEALATIERAKIK